MDGNTSVSNEINVNEQKNIQNNIHVQEQELNLDAKVTVRSIAKWTVDFARKADGYGDVLITPNGTVRLSRNEIIAQVQSGNKLFTGIDGIGSHAHLYIEDAATRREVDFENETRKQNVLTKNKVKYLFAIDNQSEFEKQFKTEIYTRAEKYAVMEIMKELKINDYSKISFAEQHTGFKYNN